MDLLHRAADEMKLAILPELLSSKYSHLYSTFPELKEHKISDSTIRIMFDTPDKGDNASANSYREPHQDAHYLFGQDFPAPGYLLNVSGYIFLENKSELSQECDGLTNASIYDTNYIIKWKYRK